MGALGWASSAQAVCAKTPYFWQDPFFDRRSAPCKAQRAGPPHRKPQASSQRLLRRRRECNGLRHRPRPPLRAPATAAKLVACICATLVRMRLPCVGAAPKACAHGHLARSVRPQSLQFELRLWCVDLVDIIVFCLRTSGSKSFVDSDLVELSCCPCACARVAGLVSQCACGAQG